MNAVTTLRSALEPYHGQRLVVAVSGGLDSMSLLNMMVPLQKDFGLELIVAHADHGLRRSSAKDAALVRRVAAGHGLPFYETTLDLSKAAPGNIEQQAREARYAWLEEVRAHAEADYIVTAHQADDQVETLFLHLARGSGLSGLTGMRVETGTILRPLLDVPRKDLTKYARRHKVAYRLDPTNKNLRLARNRVRRQIITSLQKINPQLVETVSQSMRVLADEHAVLRSLAETEMEAVVVSRAPGSIVLDLARLCTLKRGLRHLVWRETLRELYGNLQDIRLIHLENLDGLLQRQAGTMIHLPKELMAHRRSDSLAFRFAAGSEPPEPVTWPLSERVLFGDWQLQAQDSPPAPSQVFAVIDPAVTGQTLRVRAPKTGDRLKPIGMRGSKLLSDLLTDAKVPRDERPWVPVVTTESGDVVWVAGYRADRRFVPEASAQSLYLTLTPAVQ